MPWTSNTELAPIFFNRLEELTSEVPVRLQASYRSFVNYIRAYYFNGQFSFIKQNLNSQIENGDPDITNNGSETLNAFFNRQIYGGFKSPIVMARAIHDHKCYMINEKQARLCNNKMRKRSKATFDRLTYISMKVNEFNQLSMQEQCNQLFSYMHSFGTMSFT